MSGDHQVSCALYSSLDAPSLYFVNAVIHRIKQDKTRQHWWLGVFWYSSTSLLLLEHVGTEWSFKCRG